jgi:Ricin-type beta-trefoil lectin domain-like
MTTTAGRQVAETSYVRFHMGEENVRIPRNRLLGLAAVAVLVTGALMPAQAASAASATPAAPGRPVAPAVQAASACSSKYGSSWGTGPYRYAGVPASNANQREMVLDVSYPYFPDGTIIHLWHYANTQNQFWCLRRHDFYDGSHAWQLRSLYSGKCMDVAVDSPITNGDKVWQWSCKEPGDSTFISQLWDIIAHGSVTVPGGSATAYYFQHENTLQCLDVTGQSVIEGATLQTWSCKYSGNQLFY